MKKKTKEFEIFKNGTQQGTVWAKNLKEAKGKVFATYGEHREVYEVEYDEYAIDKLENKYEVGLSQENLRVK